MSDAAHEKGKITHVSFDERSSRSPNSQQIPSKRKAVTSPARRRTSRACDQCNQARTKCNGQTPCDHCNSVGIRCAYERTQKKRGKAPKSEAKQRAQTSTSTHASAPSTDSQQAGSTAGQSQSEPTNDHQLVRIESTATADTPSDSSSYFPPHANYMNVPPSFRPYSSLDMSTPHTSNMMSSEMDGILSDGFQMMDPSAFQAFGSLDQQSLHDFDMAHPMRRLNEAVYIHDFAHDAPQDAPKDHHRRYSSNLPMMDDGQDYNTAFAAGNPAGRSPDSLSHHSSTGAGERPVPKGLRYPVLQPLLPYLKTVKISPSLASELLEHYFASSFKSHPHPSSPYVIAYVFSKRPFLGQDNPRACRPALLASILWLSAHTCEALASPAIARPRACQKLLDLTLKLLNPLVHLSSTALSEDAVLNQTQSSHPTLTAKIPEFNASSDHISPPNVAQGTLDDVATYMHLAIVVSAGEDKGASLRWWTAAWNLARELKLGHELPPNAPSRPKPRQLSHGELDAGSGDDEGENSDQESSPTARVTEQEREERRRLWWILYIVDRHLSLCYNKPLMLQDRQCQGLFRPIDEKTWQTGDFNVSNPAHLGLDEARALSSESRTASIFDFTGPSVYGFMLPVMAVLGEIIDLVQASNHPFFGRFARHSGPFDGARAIVSQQLDQYKASLEAYRRQYIGDASKHADQTNHQENNGQDKRRLNESQIEIIIACAYGVHCHHVMHVLLMGKWDPVQLLDDDEWLSTQEFVSATWHAVTGAEAVTEILEYDPELNFCPYLYGIYLLHGSFILLLVADKWQSNASPAVVKACSTIIRAHEACVVTLNTEYQRNFRKIMQSALAQVYRRLPDESIEQHRRRRRELLSLYRWSGNGTGLAI